MAVTDVENERRRLVGHANFVRRNPRSDKFIVHKFHHIEFYTTDATSTCKRLQHGLGMRLVGKSDSTTGNVLCTSYVLQSGEFVLVITAPAAPQMAKGSCCAVPGYSAADAFEFVRQHGLAVRSIGIHVEDAAEAHRISTAHGGISVLEPHRTEDDCSGKAQVVSEVKAYGDVVLRFVSGDFDGPYLANYEVVGPSGPCFEIDRIDHCVGNVPRLFDVTDYLMAATGFHEFAEFTAEDVGTVDSGLNSMVLANNNEYVLMPVNEPTYGTRRQSQIQTYLDYNNGPGVQHLALKTNDIFHTVGQMRAATASGGLEFMPKASADYYKNLPDKVGDVLTPAQYKLVEELGLLVDKDDQGVLLQIFTKPIGDRPTFFFEIIQRIGCESTQAVQLGDRVVTKSIQAGGCGGFGKGNFRELFRSIERFEEEELGV